MQRLMTWRAITLIIVIALTIVGVTANQVVNAQDGDDAERRLAVGQAVTGELSAENFAESYIFSASAGDTATLTAITSEETLSLVLLLVAPNGQTVATDADLSSATVATLSDVSLDEDGTYVVTVLRGNGADGDGEGTYTLSLTGNINEPAAVSTDSGSTGSTAGRDVFVQLDDGTIDIQLEWSSAVDLNLEVRDPVGNAIYWENAEVVSGGAHGGNTNQVCEEATADAPTESVTWTQSSVPAGSYEILVYYQQACGQNGPQRFTVTTAINGEEAESFEGLINPGQVYLGRVTLDLQQNWSLFNGGVNAGVTDFYDASTVEAVAIGNVVDGIISNENIDDAYTFAGTSGSDVAIEVTATSGSLDTVLVLLDPNGNRVTVNDDAPDGTTNSAIDATLTQDGDYTIVVTRYAQGSGGTEGNYSLSLSAGQTTAATDDTDTTDDTGTDTTDVSATPVANSSLPAGSIEVQLDWATNVDLQLLVRDPNGEAVFDDNPQGTFGGILGAVGNQGCVPATGTPTSYIYWPEGRTPAQGTYEIDIWYQDDCDDNRITAFTLNINVGGETVFNTNQTASPNSHYIISFTIGADGSVTPLTNEDGGFVAMADILTGLNYVDQIGTAQPIEFFETVQGTITAETRFQIYSFDALAGDRFSVAMRGTTGNLDTAVYIVGPQPNIQQAFNDDTITSSGERDTNSRIAEFTAPTDGTYYIIATHYGLRFGGTVGGYTLTLTQLP